MGASLLTWLRVFDLPLTGPGLPRSVAPGMLRVRDAEDGGFGRLAATVKQVGTPNSPVWRRVRLLDRRTGRCIRETWSDPVTGLYEFTYIALNREYTVVAYDHTGVHNAVIADPILAEPMP